MAQHDYVIANGTGAAVRSDLNNALAAIVSQNSGATEPATTYAYQFWADTTTATLKLRNSANSAWIELMQLDGTLTMEDGTEALPGLSFRNDLDTGLWRPGANQLAISTNAVERVEFGASEVVFNDGGANYDFRVEGDTNANLLFVDASADAVGIGTSTPGTALDVNGAIRSNDIFTLYKNSTDAFYIGAGTIITGGTSTDIALRSNQNGSILFSTNGATERMRIDASGNVGIGTTSPGTVLDIVGSGNPTLTLRGSAVNNSPILNLQAGGSGESVIDATGGSTALRLLISGSERARIDSSGRLLVGTSTARSNFYNDTNSAFIQLESASNDGSALALIQNFNANTLGGQLILAKSNSASVGSNTLVASDDACGRITFQGNDGTQFVEAAQIRCDIDGTPGANDMPGRIVLSTTADGASLPTERVRIAANGDIIFRNLPTVYPFTDNAVQLGGGGTRFTALYAVNGTIQTSDQREKTEITDSLLGSDFIKSLRPVSYKWIEGGNQDTGERDEQGNYIYKPAPGVRTHWGFVAQEVKQAIDAAGVDFGGWVLIDKDDPDSQQALRYDQFIAPLTKALQEALAEIDLLKAKVAALESA